jgi:hypothetical protein
MHGEDDVYVIYMILLSIFFYPTFHFFFQFNLLIFNLFILKFLYEIILISNIFLYLIEILFFQVFIFNRYLESHKLVFGLSLRILFLLNKKYFKK